MSVFLYKIFFRFQFTPLSIFIAIIPYRYPFEISTWTHNTINILFFLKVSFFSFNLSTKLIVCFQLITCVMALLPQYVETFQFTRYISYFFYIFVQAILIVDVNQMDCDREKNLDRDPSLDQDPNFIRVAIGSNTLIKNRTVDSLRIYTIRQSYLIPPKMIFFSAYISYLGSNRQKNAKKKIQASFVPKNFQKFEKIKKQVFK